AVPHEPFQRALDVNAENLVEHFPEYERLGTGPKAIEFALTKIFFGNTEAHLRDVEALRSAFDFDALVCDAAFYAGYLIAEKLHVPSYAVAPAPTPAPTSAQAPPPFFGLTPARSVFGRLRDRVVRALLAKSCERGMTLFSELLQRE